MASAPNHLGLIVLWRHRYCHVPRDLMTASEGPAPAWSRVDVSQADGDARASTMRRSSPSRCSLQPQAGCVRALAAVSPAVVATVTDGDTVRLADGRRVRLVQIDTPELNTGECYSRAARKALLRLVPERSAVGLETDPGLDQVDRYGGVRRYLRRGGANVNIEARPPGRGGAVLLRRRPGTLCGPAAGGGKNREGRQARALGRVPGHGAQSIPGGDYTAEGRDAPSPSFRGAAVTPRIRPCASRRIRLDLDCADVPARGASRVVGTDPHGFDGDRDGVGCET